MDSVVLMSTLEKRGGDAGRPRVLGVANPLMPISIIMSYDMFFTKHHNGRAEIAIESLHISIVG